MNEYEYAPVRLTYSIDKQMQMRAIYHEFKRLHKF